MRFTLSGLSADIACWDKIKTLNSNDIVIEIESMLVSNGKPTIRAIIRRQNGLITIANTYKNHEDFQKILDTMAEDYIIEHCPKNIVYADSENYEVMTKLKKALRTRAQLVKL